MKKVGVLLVLFLLLIPFVLGQSATTQPATTQPADDSTGDVDDEDLERGDDIPGVGQTTQRTGEAAGELIGSAGEATGKFKESSNKLITEEIEIPEYLQLIAEVLFDLDEKVQRHVLIITLAFWLFIFLFLFAMLDAFLFFKGAVKLILSLLIMVILSTLNMLSKLTEWVVDLTNQIRFLEGFSLISTIIVVGGLVLAWLVIKGLLDIFKTRKEATESREEGQEMGAELATMKWIKNMFSRVGSKMSGLFKEEPISPPEETHPWLR